MAELEAAHGASERVGWSTGHVNLQNNVQFASHANGLMTVASEIWFERTDDVVRQGSDAQQRLRTARSGVCRARPPERNMCSHLVIIDGIFRKDSAKVLDVETRSNDQCRRAGPTRLKRSAYRFCQGERNEVGRSGYRWPRTRALNVPPNALSLYWAPSPRECFGDWRASHAAVGFWSPQTTTAAAVDGEEQEKCE